MLRLDDHWIWDSWIADDGADYHLYFLQAPSALGDGNLRHARARIGHASSPDLHTWTYTGEVFGPNTGGWDDLAVWTGSTVRGDDGRWRMFYTAISTRGHELRDQRIGMAESQDLVTWRRVTSDPIATVDPAIYKTLDEDHTASETWRDPFVFADPDGDGWHMLITARAVGAGRKRRRRARPRPQRRSAQLGSRPPGVCSRSRLRSARGAADPRDRRPVRARVHLPSRRAD